MKKTIRYLKPYRATVTWGLIIKFVGSIAELFLPLILEYIIDNVVPSKDLTNIILMGVLMLGCSLVALFGNIIANRLAVRAAGNMTHDLRLDLFTKTSLLQCRQVDEITSPSLISRLTSDTYYVNQMVARSLRLGVRAPILLIGGIILTFTLDVNLALVLLATVPFVIVAIVVLTKKSVPCYFEVQSGNDDMVRSMQENISGVRVVKALSKGEYEKDKFYNISERLAAKEFKANRIMSLTNPLATLILNLGLVGVIAVGAYMSAASGKLLAFMSYFTIILNAMLGLSKIFVVLSRGVASADRIEKVLSLDEKQIVGEYQSGDEGFKIQFKDVNFSYNGKENNLENVSFALKEGQTLGIIGATGSGKSTIINLLMRFYDVNEGGVYIDGKDVRGIEPNTLRLKFGVAFQNDFLMAASVKDNVDYLRGLDDGEINSAEKCSCAEEFIQGLNGGDGYLLTQKASNLSGGQKQRLLIARALAGDPEIIVLDDSSSALDYATDAALRKNLNENYSNSTKIIIAQRVSSIINADLILVLDDGKVIGKGTHESLLKTCDEYSQIYNVQMGATRV
jgi:ATP-binding cassette subfamily B protein